jgi:hypothetical protein
MAALQVIDEVLEGDSRAPKAGRAAHYVGVPNDYPLNHKSTLSQRPGVMFNSRGETIRRSTGGFGGTSDHIPIESATMPPWRRLDANGVHTSIPCREANLTMTILCHSRPQTRQSWHD